MLREATQIFRISALTGVLFLALSATSIAQQIEEIVVTATKRGETLLQNTPLSITALGRAELTAMGVDSAADYLRSVPGLVFEEQGIGDKKYTLRGVQSVGAATTSVYFDDMVFTANNRQDGGGRNADPKMVDMERIEVLRGPQGTLYGASSMTGTIRLISRRPNLQDYELALSGQAATTKHGGDSFNIDGILNLPLVENELALRLVAYDRNEAGWIDRPLISDKDVNDENTTGFRAHMLWEPADTLSLFATIIDQESSTDGRSNWEEEHRGDPFQRYEHCDPKEVCNAEITRSGQDDDWTAYSLSLDYQTEFGNFFLTSGLLDRFFVRSLDNSNIIAFIRGIRLPDGSLDRFNPMARHMIRQTQDRSLWSSEARFSSSWNGPLQLIAGVFYQEETNEFHSNVGSTDSDGYFEDEAVRDNSLWRRVDTEIDHSAIFGDLTYALTDSLSATVGARYFEFDVEEISESIVGCCSGNLPGSGLGPTRASQDDDVNLKFNLSYQWTEDVLLYAQAAEGFRSGGTNEPSILSEPFCEGFEGFGSDSLWSYELGLKTRWLNDRLTVNMTPYFIEWSDIQVRTQVSECLSFFIQNAGEAEVLGVEVETSWHPTDTLTIGAAFGYADAELTEDQPFQSGPLIDGLSGDDLPYTPNLTAKLSLEHTFPLSRLPADLQTRIDWSYTDDSNTEFRPTNPRFRAMPDYHLVDARVGLIGHDGWRAVLFVENVFNELADVSRFTSSLDGDYVFTNRPREIGVLLSKEFF